jgi:hypothetical protein
MRSPIRAPAALTLALLASLATCLACARDKRAAPSAERQPSAGPEAPVEIDGRALAEARANEAVAPRLGGSVVFVDDYQVELAVHGDGAVQGLVFDGEGNALAHAGVTGFKLSLRGADGSKPDVALSWDEACPCYRGQADVAAGLVAEPVAVSLSSLGSTHTGVLSGYTLLAPGNGSRNTSGQLVGATKHKDLAAPNARASLPAGAATKAATKGRTKPKASAPKATAKHKAKKTATASGASVKARAGFALGTK